MTKKGQRKPKVVAKKSAKEKTANPTLKINILLSFGPNSNADEKFGLGQSSFVQSSCKAEMGCMSDR
jgi:hypothetical protein